MQLKPGMLLHVTLMALLVAIAVVATASTAVASYSSQGTALPTTAELTTNKDSLNGIVFDMSYDSWSTMYQSLKQSDQYDWMDWSTDNCSGPDVGRHDTFQHACLRHDLSWRNLALIDQATGRVWNERNRYAANQQFLWDMEDACDQAFVQSSLTAQRLQTIGVYSVLYSRTTILRATESKMLSKERTSPPTKSLTLLTAAELYQALLPFPALMVT